MQTSRELLYNDAYVVLLFVYVLFAKNIAGFWNLLFAYFLVKQLFAHWENYKLNHRWF